jgi:hypothetical protein
MPRYRISIVSKDREAMLDLVRKHKFSVFDHGNSYSDEEGYTVGGIAEPETIQTLREAGYQIQQHEDVDERGKDRQREVGKGDRYKGTQPD